MRIKSVRANGRRRAFELSTEGADWLLPYAQLRLLPEPSNPVVEVFVDPELGNEGFTYRLASGGEDSVHMDAVLEYNRDPGAMSDLVLYRLTVEAQQRVQTCGLSKREIIRRLGTSASQFYRLLDQTNYAKSIGQMITLLQVVDCDVELVVTPRRAARS